MIYTYIFKKTPSIYVELNEELPSDYYEIGTSWQDYIEGKWVLLSAEQVSFRQENPSASVLEVWNMQMNPPHVRTLEMAKNEKLNEIDEYDVSDAVNSFTVNHSIEGWFTPAERSNYRNSIDAAKVLGVEELSFYVGNISLTVPTSLAEQMLAQVQLYADQCFMVTKAHKANVDVLQTIEDVDNYNFRTGYPERLNFNLIDE